MKTVKILSMLMVLICIMTLSCKKWTEAKSDDYNFPLNSDSYYANLRAWKADTTGGKGITFGWFGGWTGSGTALNSSLIGLPDSMHMVSIWGDWKNINEAKRKDLVAAQTIKGLKVLACAFAMNIGDGFTPTGKSVKEYWGWDASETGLNATPTANQEQAIRKYARAISHLVDSLGYDGFDMDFEPNFGGGGDLASSGPRLKIFINELGKSFGLKSGTGKILAVDGEPQSMPAETGPYFDYFIVQAYDATSYTNLNNRLTSTVNNFSTTMKAWEVSRRYVATENFEKAAYYTTGGANFTQEDKTVTKSLAGMAGWQPLIGGVRYKKGGVGSYHVEYEYQVPGQNGFYPFTRNAIRIMNAK